MDSLWLLTHVDGWLDSELGSPTTGFGFSMGQSSQMSPKPKDHVLLTGLGSPHNCFLCYQITSFGGGMIVVHSKTIFTSCGAMFSFSLSLISSWQYHNFKSPHQPTLCPIQERGFEFCMRHLHLPVYFVCATCST